MSIDKNIRDDYSRVFLHLWGTIGGGETIDEVILNPRDLISEPSHLKVYAVDRFIQSGLCLLFYWEGESEHTLMFPLEGYGRIALDKEDGFLDPRKEGATGKVVLKIVNDKEETKHFAVKIEFMKQRG